MRERGRRRRQFCGDPCGPGCEGHPIKAEVQVGMPALAVAHFAGPVQVPSGDRLGCSYRRSEPASHAGCGPESICLLKSCRLFNITTCKAWKKKRFYHSLYKFPKDVVNPLVILKVAKTEVKSLRTKPSDSSFFKQQCCPRNLALNGKSEV